MSVAVVQTKSSDSNSANVTTLNVTFDAAPAEGNLIRVMLVSTFSVGTVTGPSGWTLEYSNTTLPGEVYFYYKIAGPSESAVVTLSWTSSRRVTLMAREYAGVDTSTPFDTSASAVSATKPLNTGATGTISAGNAYAEAWFGVAQTQQWATGRSYTNSYVEDAIQEEPGAAPAAYIASNSSVTPGGTTSTEFDTTGAGGGSNGRLVVFNNGPLTAGVISADNRTATTADLSSTDASGGASPYVYQWHRSTTPGFTPSGATEISGATSLTLNDTGLTQGQTYYYKLVYEDNVAATVTSNQVSVTPSSSPLVVITDMDGNTSGIVQVMGPNVAIFNIGGSLLGAGKWQNVKVEWNFGDPGSDYNIHEGFVAGHFYDVEPASNRDFIVTCTITNSAGASSSSNRTVRVTPNTRRIVYVNNSTGSASPVDPTDPNDAYDTIVNCETSETLTDLEVRMQTGQTHTWGVTFGGSSGSNYIVRSTQKGVRFRVSATTGPLMSGGFNACLRDVSVIASSSGSQVKMLDPRAANATNCYAINCVASDNEVNICFTGATSKGTLLQDCSSNGHDAGGDVFFGGSNLVCHNVQSLNYLGGERPFRGGGDWITLNRCVGRYNAVNGKTAFTRSGGQWCYVTDCDFSLESGATGGSGTPLQIGHTSGTYAPGPVNTIVQRTLLTIDPGATGSLQLMTIGGDVHNVDNCTVRNCVMISSNTFIITIGSGDASYPTTFVEFYHNTIISSALHVRQYWNDIIVKHNLFLDFSGIGILNLNHGTNPVANQNVNVSDNVWAVTDDNNDVRIDNDVVRISWASFNALSNGSGNISKTVAYDAETYRPTDTGDTDLLKTALPAMGAVPDDYYSNIREGLVLVGAVDELPIPGIDIGPFVGNITRGRNISSIRYVGRLSGVITYNDDTTAEFFTTLDERGVVAVNPPAPCQPLIDVIADHDWLETMLSLISPGLVLSPVGASSAGKTVNDATLHFYGRATGGGIVSDFLVEYRGSIGYSVVNDEGYDSIPASVIVNWLEGIAGVGNVTA